MAERIDRITVLKGRPPIYPWPEWTNGSTWRITRGEDFKVSAYTMSQLIRQRGLRYGVPVSARLDGDSVEFQFEVEGKRAA